MNLQATTKPRPLKIAPESPVMPGGSRQAVRWHPFWDLAPLARSPERMAGGHPLDHRGRLRYQVRALRYWFMYHLIHREAQARQRPLDFCEVVVGTGEMLSFMKMGEAPGERGPLPGFVNTWDALSWRIDEPRMTALGYSRCFSKNVEDADLALPRQYDVLILLHVLEHLHEPERVVANLLPFVKDGGLIMGGHPSLPHPLCGSRERHLRRKAESFGHVSAFSPRRIKRMAKTQDLVLEFFSGAYLFRKTGFMLEQYGWWIRMNLLVGALLPAWPGEIYWAMRKPPVAPFPSSQGQS